jgi:formylglycine-generating enzyme
MEDHACCAPAAEPRATPTTPTTRTAPVRSGRRPRGQVRVPAGTFAMGDAFGEGYPGDGEGPVHEVRLDAFSMDATAVTNAQFAAFVKDTGHVTGAEEFGISAVFHLAFHGDPADVLNRAAGVPWWLAVRGASWRAPEGPGSDVSRRQNHPVVHVDWHDAQAYAAWAGKRLPTEAEWEYAARGGLAGARFAWGDELTPRGRWMCNIWQGTFPTVNTEDDGHLTTAPVTSYSPNGYGLSCVAGNVWEWCADWFSPTYYAQSPDHDPHGPDEGEQRVMRGGSYLCHDSYCNRYRVSARSSNTPESTSGNTGFRCAGDG